MRYRALDYGFQLEASPPPIARFWADALRHLADDGGGSADERWTVDLDRTGQVTVAGPHLPGIAMGPTPAFARLMTSINVAAIASRDDRPVLHASAATVAGRAIVAPAHPGSGKSTLVAGLTASGCGYLTDEAVPLDADGRALPYPKPIVVGQGSWAALESAEPGRILCEGVELSAWYLDPARLGATVERAPTPIAVVVLPLYRQGASTRIEAITPAEATAAMSTNLFNLRRHGMAAVELCGAVTTGATCVRAEYSRFDDLIPRLVELAQP